MKRTSFILLIAAAFICSAVIARCGISSGESADFVYSGADTRDPFVPLVTKEGKVQVSSGGIASVKDIVLEGILYDPGGESVVIINNLVLKENDQIGKIKVKKIERDRAILTYEGEDYEFKAKEQ